MSAPDMREGRPAWPAVTPLHLAQPPEDPHGESSAFDPDEAREALDVHLDQPGEVSVGSVKPRTRFRSFPTTAQGLDEAVEFALALDREGALGVYARGSTVRTGVANGRGTEADTIVVPAFALDVDLADPVAHRSLTLPPDAAAALEALVASGLPEPTEIVSSGFGFYPRWVLNEPTNDLVAAKALAVDLHAVAAAAFSEKRWGLDACTDLARVWRLPGSINRKGGGARPCRVIARSGEVYSFAELRDAVTRPESAPIRRPGAARTSRGPVRVMGASKVKTLDWIEAKVDDELRELVAGGTVDFHQRLMGAAAIGFRAVGAGVLGESELEARLENAIAHVWSADPDANDRQWIEDGRRTAAADPWRLRHDDATRGSATTVNTDQHDEAAGAQVPAVRRLLPVRAADVRPRRMKWLWTLRVVVGGLTLLAGREGLGKSTIAVDLAAQVTRGEVEGEHFGEPRNVIYLHSEDSRDFTIVPRLRAANADLNRVVFLDAQAADGGADRLTLPRDVPLLEEVIREHEAVLVVLDAATSMIDGGLDGDRDRQMRQGLEPIGAMADRTGAAVLGLVHFGKRDSRDTGRLILGSIAWSQVARSVIAVARDEDGGDLVISTTKANLAPGDSPSIGARLVDCPVETDEGVTRVGRVEWLGETDRNATDLLSDSIGGDGEDREDRSRAEQWLEEYLTEYDRPKSAEVKKAARDADISERTLARARKKLGVLIETEGSSASGASGPRRTTVWTLPDVLESSRATDQPSEEAGSGTTEGEGSDQGRSDSEQSSRASRASHATRAPIGDTTGTTDQWRRSGTPVRSA